MTKKKTIKLSATRINSYLQCKLKYWFNYHEHLPKIANPAFLLGRAVHESLELAGQIWMEKGLFNDDDKKRILDLYEEVSIREGISNMIIHEEGKQLIKNRLNDFDLGKGIISLEYLFGEGNDDIITEDGVYLIGAMDKVIKVDEDTLLIVDYKTSKTAPTSDQLKTDVQLSIYDVAANIKWPEYSRIILCLDLLKSEMLYTYRTKEERKEFTHYIKSIRDGMLSLKKKDAKSTLNTFCPWCDYKDYCDTYKEACEKSNYKFLPILNYNQEELMNEWKTVKVSKKILEERERELAMIIMEKIRKNNANLIGESEEVYIRQNARSNYDIDIVSKLISYDEFIKLVNLNKKSVVGFMNENPAVKEEIESSAHVSYTAPFLAVKKIKS